MYYQEIAFEEAVSCFGMDRVSFSADSTHYFIIIAFPEFTIRNSYNKSHLITDMYVRLKLNLSDGRLQGLAGTRTIVTPEEYNSNYLQSHIHADRNLLGEFDEFCTGHSVITDLKASLASQFNQDKFAGLLFSLEEMVSWESKEGTPYISIDQISMRNQAPSTINVPDLEQIKLLFLKNSNLKFDYSFIDLNTKVSLEIPKEQIEETLSSLLFDKPHYYVEKVGIQYFRVGSTTGGVVENKGLTNWQFNGKHLPIKVRSLKETNSNTVKVIHPHILKLIHEEISKEFQRFLEQKLS